MEFSWDTVRIARLRPRYMQSKNRHAVPAEALSFSLEARIHIVASAIRQTYQRPGRQWPVKFSPEERIHGIRERERGTSLLPWNTPRSSCTREKGREGEKEREKCPVWGFNWQKRGSAAMARKSGGKRVERGEREVIPSTADYSKRQWSRLLAFSAKGRDFDRPTFLDIDGISSFHVCSCAWGRARGKGGKRGASTCPSLPDRARRYPERPVYADEWNSFQGTLRPALFRTLHLGAVCGRE